MFMYSSQYKWLVRAIASAVVVCFVWQDVLFAQGGVPTWSSVKSKNIPRNTISAIEVPYDAGVARVVKPFNSDEIIVNIQDAHGSLDAQKSIARMLESLVKGYELNIVGIEGSSGRVDTSLVSSFPMEKVRAAAGEALLADTQISASEFYNIVSGDTVELYGVEDLDLYKKNITSYRRVLSNQARTRVEMTHVAAAMEKIAERVFSENLARITKNAASYRVGDMTFSEYWKIFRLDTALAGVTTEGYPNATKLATTVDLESTVDFRKANEQRDLLIKELRRLLKPEEFRQLELLALQFKLGKLTPARFHGDLVARAKAAGIAPEGFVDFILYAEYLMLFEEIDLVQIFDEIEAMEELVKEKIFRNDEERVFDRTQKAVRIFAKLLEAKMSSADDRFYAEHPELFGVERLRRYLEEMGIRHKTDYAASVDWDFLAAEVPTVESFYQDVKTRNDAMLGNLVQRMKEKGQKIAAIVTGGFHTEGLSELMDSRRISHIVMMPKFDEKSGERPYLTVITERGSYLDTEIRLRAQEDAIALVVGLATLSGMKFEEAKRLYADSYRDAVSLSGNTEDLTESAAVQPLGVAPDQRVPGAYINVATMGILGGKGVANLPPSDVLEVAVSLVLLASSSSDVEIAILSTSGSRAVKVSEGNPSKNVSASVSPSRYTSSKLTLMIQGARLRSGAETLKASAATLDALSNQFTGVTPSPDDAALVSWLRAAVDRFEYVPNEETDANEIRRAFIEYVREAEKIERRTGRMPFKIISSDLNKPAKEAEEKILKQKAILFAPSRAVVTKIQPGKRRKYLFELSKTQRLEPSIKLLKQMNDHFSLAGSESALTMNHLLRDLSAVNRQLSKAAPAPDVEVVAEAAVAFDRGDGNDARAVGHLHADLLERHAAARGARKPHLHPARFQVHPRVHVGGKLDVRDHHVVAFPPVDAVGDDRDAFGGVLDERDFVRVCVDKCRRLTTHTVDLF